MSTLVKSDSFANDWYGWLTNECGHGWVGFVLSLPLLALGCPDAPTVFIVWLLYFFIVEVVDQKLRLVYDGISDSLHVVFGSWLAVLLPEYGQAMLVAVGWGIVLAYGVWRRI